MKTEISGQNFPKIFACGGQNDEKFSPAASKIVKKKLRAKYEIFNKNLATSKFNLRIKTKNSLNCVQRTMKTMNLRKKITMKTMKMGKNNHENHEKLLKNG